MVDPSRMERVAFTHPDDGQQGAAGGTVRFDAGDRVARAAGIEAAARPEQGRDEAFVGGQEPEQERLGHRGGFEARDEGCGARGGRPFAEGCFSPSLPRSSRVARGGGAAAGADAGLGAASAARPRRTMLASAARHSPSTSARPSVMMSPRASTTMSRPAGKRGQSSRNAARTSRFARARTTAFPTALDAMMPNRGRAGSSPSARGVAVSKNTKCGAATRAACFCTRT